MRERSAELDRPASRLANVAGSRTHHSARRRCRPPIPDPQIAGGASSLIAWSADMVITPKKYDERKQQAIGVARSGDKRAPSDRDSLDGCTRAGER